MRVYRLFGLLLFLPALGWGESVYLKDGSQVRGEIKNKSVELETPNGSLSIKKDQIRMITFSTAPAPAVLSDLTGSASDWLSTLPVPVGASVDTARLPQRIRFFRVNDIREGQGYVWVAGEGSAMSDAAGVGVSTAYRYAGSLPRSPVEVTLQNTDPAATATCLKLLRSYQPSKGAIDLEGKGQFARKYLRDSIMVLVFKFASISACREAPTAELTSTPTPNPAALAPVGPAGALPIKDVLAVPERYLDKPIVVEGRLGSLTFSEPLSTLMLYPPESTSYNFQLMCLWSHEKLPAKDRLALAHAPNSARIQVRGFLRKGLTALPPNSPIRPPGYWLELTNLTWISPPLAPAPAGPMMRSGE